MNAATLIHQTNLQKERLEVSKPSRKPIDNLNHDDQYNLIHFFNLLLEIDQRNYINTCHVLPSQKGGETNDI